MTKVQSTKIGGEEFVSFKDAMAEAVLFKPANLGQNFDEFLAEEGMLETVRAAAIKRVIAFQRSSLDGHFPGSTLGLPVHPPGAQSDESV